MKTNAYLENARQAICEIIGKVKSNGCTNNNELRKEAVFALTELDAFRHGELQRWGEQDNKKALLGLATTRQLLKELESRAELGGYANYRTIDGD